MVNLTILVSNYLVYCLIKILYDTLKFLSDMMSSLRVDWDSLEHPVLVLKRVGEGDGERILGDTILVSLPTSQDGCLHWVASGDEISQPSGARSTNSKICAYRVH